MQNTIKSRMKFREVAIMTAAWVIIAFIGVWYDYLTIYSVVYEIGIEKYDLKSTLITTLLGVLMAGLIGGSFYVFYLKDRFRGKPFLYSALLNSAIMLVIIIVLGILSAVIYNSIFLESSPFSLEVFYGVIEFSRSSLIWQNTAVWFLFTLGTIFVLQVRDRYGQGI
jgi:hypothetical protein